ncbi:MAG: hypothetical protein ABR553_11300, partial [Gammaproteobacteria bacterium]
VGRMLTKAMAGPGADLQPVQVDVDQLQLEAGNPFELHVGRYARVVLHCRQIRSSDAFIDELFASCAIGGSQVRQLDSRMRCWLTTGRDGCIVLDRDADDRNSIQVYMGMGGYAASLGDVVFKPGGVDDTQTSARLLKRFAHERLVDTDAEGEPLELFRLMRRDRSSLPSVFHRTGEAAAKGLP